MPASRLSLALANTRPETDWQPGLTAHGPLQRLPVPELDSSLAMYLHSVRPFLTEPEFEEYQVRPPLRAQTAARRILMRR